MRLHVDRAWTQCPGNEHRLPGTPSGSALSLTGENRPSSVAWPAVLPMLLTAMALRRPARSPSSVPALPDTQSL